MAAFEIGRGQVIEDQGAVGEVAFGQFLLDARLSWEEPVHGLVEFVLVGGIEMEQLAETAEESVGVKSASGGKFGSWIEDAGDDHGEDEIAVAGGKRVEDGIELEVAQTAEDGGSVTMRQGAGDEEGIGPRGGANRERAGQGGAEGMDLLLGEMGEIGQGTSFNFAVLAVGFAEEEGGRGVAVGDGGDVHAYTISQQHNKHKHNNNYIHAYK